MTLAQLQQHAGAAALHRGTREKKVEPQIVLYCGKLADDRYREPGIIPFQRGRVLLATDNVRIKHLRARPKFFHAGENGRQPVSTRHRNLLYRLKP